MPFSDSGSAEQESSDLGMMRLALALAREAALIGEIPVGSVIVREGIIVAQAHNLREALDDPTAHAERIALTLAGRSIGSWRLDGCTLFVTLEPCPMCAGALLQSRVERLVYGAADPKAGACRSLYRLLDDPRLNHQVRITTGVLERESQALLSGVFAERRSNRPRRGA